MRSSYLRANQTESPFSKTTMMLRFVPCQSGRASVTRSSTSFTAMASPKIMTGRRSMCVLHGMNDRASMRWTSL